MRGAAVSDLHLGFRAFAATEGGRNLRELDVERAWAAAVQEIIRARPDLVTIAGDVFHHPRVGSHAVKAFRDGVRRIVESTDALVVVLQGNHDAGRTAEVLSPIVIPDDLPRVQVVTRSETLHFQLRRTSERVAIACLPCETLSEARVIELAPDPDADVNVLLIHAPVNTSAEDVERLPMFYAGDQALDAGALAEEFDIVAAGDFHEFRRLHASRLAFYSGSIERTSSNIWPEAAPKGVAVYDTWNRHLEFRAIPTRRMLDLGARHRDVAAVNALLDRLNRDLDCERVGVADAIVRLVVEEFPRSDRDAIDWSLVRSLKNTCAHFQLDLRFAAPRDVEAGDRREHSARSLIDEAQLFFADDEVPIRDCALAYLGGA